MIDQPLILTLRLDSQSQAYFNELRKTHFPPAINYLDAHLTLFHQLPFDDAVTNEIEQAANIDAFSVDATEVFHTGFGVAFRIVSHELATLHGQFKKAFSDLLIPQDRQPFRPHITVQNKVTPEKSKALVATLQKSFQPFTATATGLDTWLYQNGPWLHQRFFEFNRA